MLNMLDKSNYPMNLIKADQNHDQKLNVLVITNYLMNWINVD